MQDIVPDQNKMNILLKDNLRYDMNLHKEMVIM